MDDIPQPEMDGLRAAKKTLDIIQRWYDTQMAYLRQTPEPENIQQEMEDQAVWSALRIIEDFKIWKCRYVAGGQTGQKRLSDMPTAELPQAAYFVSASGVALGFNFAQRGQGFGHVVTGLMEGVRFEKDGMVSDVPTDGCSIVELNCAQFLQLFYTPGEVRAKLAAVHPDSACPALL